MNDQTITPRNPNTGMSNAEEEFRERTLDDLMDESIGDVMESLIGRPLFRPFYDVCEQIAKTRADRFINHE